MLPCSPIKSTILLHSNYWENCEHDKGYEGQYILNQDQVYEGEFYRDSFHGQGTYKWRDLAVYEGGFYSNRKEGYASVSFPDNSYFEGLFIQNQPFGPGILTYSNGRQDAGFWVGRKLVRLSRAVDFIIPRLAPTTGAKIKLLQFRRLISLENSNDSSTDILKKYGYLLHHFSTPYSSLVYDPRSVFFDKQTFEKAYFLNINQLINECSTSLKNWTNSLKDEVHNQEYEKPCPSPCLCIQDKEPDNMDICGRESFKGEYETGILGHFTKEGKIDGVNGRKDEESELQGESMSFDGEDKKDSTKCSKILSWNRSALCTEILKQIFRYRAFEDKLHFNLGKLMIGDRTAFRRTGEKEMQCLHFLKMCSLGPAHVVKDLLCLYEISQELMDARGNNSLMFAAATDQHEVMEILLSHGVDVNTFNDENLTPLNLCLLRRLAQAEGISNWETAFLPQEIDQSLVPECPPQPEWQSISSLDRIFGDGMSINDSKSFVLDPRFFSNLSPTEVKEPEDQGAVDSDESTDIFNLSEITILNIPRSPGSYSLLPPGYDKEPRMLNTNVNQSMGLEYNEIIQKNASKEFRSKHEVVPKSNKMNEFEKSIEKSTSDKYFFEFSFEKNPNVTTSKKNVKNTRKSNKTEMNNEDYVEDEEDEDLGEAIDLELTERLAKIDKTIEKLLKRGADPNISEVPKPSIHLGVYTKDLNIVYLLLQHGANPDTQLYSNESCLTPLHVLVLLKPAAEYVDICDLLLSFGANPEEETTPDFMICEEERNLLDPERGRTPLQLLCMRPDVEYGDPGGHLIRIGLMLARVSNPKKFYNGHSYLTLAMLCGNIELLKALLETKQFDSREILEKNNGTSLHVLVSTTFQKKTSYEDSIKMCDLLIANDADPLQQVPSLGNCVEYGKKEIEEEKQGRKAKLSGKKPEKTGRGSRDHLKDHEKVVEYLGKIASDMATEKESTKQTGRSEKKEKWETSEDSPTKTSLESSLKGNKKTTQKVNEALKEDTERKDNSERKSSKNNFERGENKKNEEKERKSNKGEQKQSVKRKLSWKDEKGKKEKKEKKDSKKKKEKKKNKSKKEKLTQLKKDKTTLNRKTDSNLQRQSKSSFKSGRYVESCSETFPEKQRQLLLRMFGTCTHIDINEFLVPYVVLRDGELYYRFQGNITKSKEQYSLI